MTRKAIVVDAYLFDKVGQTEKSIEATLQKASIIIIRYADYPELSHKDRAKAATEILQAKFPKANICLCSTAGNFNATFKEIRTKYSLQEDNSILYLSGIEEIANDTKQNGIAVQLETGEKVQQEIERMRQFSKKLKMK